MSGFGEIVKETLAFKSIKGEGEITSNIFYKPLNQICVRFQNKYINNIDKHKALKESIRANGLIEPIVIVDIDEYINTCDNEQEKEYLSLMKEKGCLYFISSGHRRFKAYASLCLGRDIYTDKELDALYTDEFKQKLIDKENSVIDINNLFDDTPDWTTVPCKIISLDNEAAIYNDSNTTQREITSFEIIDNTIDEMIQNDMWYGMIKDIVNERINSMTDRAVKDNIKKLHQAGYPVSCGDKIEEQREFLKTLSYDKIPGTEKDINKKLAEYIMVNKQRNVSETAVKYTRRILKVFNKELIQLIYDGYLSFRDAQKLLDNYDKIDLEKTIEEIKTGQFDLNKTVNEKKKIRFTERQFIEYLYDIKNKKMTVDEVIEILESNQ